MPLAWFKVVEQAGGSVFGGGLSVSSVFGSGAS